MKTLILAGATGLLAMAAAAPASAQTTRPLIVEHVEVPYGDLDLAAAPGADAMLTRLASAASRACGGRPRSDFSDPTRSAKERAYRLCKVAAVDAATLELDVPLVRALWLEDGEAIRFADAARRQAADLQKLARAGDRTSPRNY